MAFASVPSLAAMFLGKFSAPSPVVDSLCLLLSTRPMVGTGEVSCPSLLCSFPYCPPPSSRHLLHLLFPPEIVDPCINPEDWNFLPVPQQLKTLLIWEKGGRKLCALPCLPCLSHKHLVGAYTKKTPLLSGLPVILNCHASPYMTFNNLLTS